MIQYFHGTMTDLYGALIRHSQKMGIDIKYHMKSVNSLSRRLSPSALQQFNIYVDRGKSNGKRYINLWKGELENND